MAKNTIQPAIDEVNKSINTIITKINELDRAILATSKNARENMKDIFAVKTPGDANKYLMENKTLIEKLNKELETQRQKQLELQKVIERLSQTRATSNQKTAEEIVNQQRLARNAKEYAVISSKLSTLYEKQSVILTQLQRKYKDVALAQGENSREARALLTQINGLDAKLKRLDANVGQYGRVVGKYGSHWQNIIPILRSAAGAFGVFSGLQIAREIFQQVKQLNSLNKALEQVTGTSQEFAAQKDFLQEKAEQYGIELKSLTKEYTKFYAALKGTNLEGEKGRQIFDSVIKTSSSLGMSQENLSGTLQAMTQIISKGTVQAEELRGQLGDRLPGAFNIMARALGVTTSELNDMLKAGEVLAEDALPKFAKELEKTYGLENVDRIETITAAQNRMSNKWTEFVDELSQSDSFFSKASIGVMNLGSSILSLLTPTKSLAAEIQKEQIELNLLVNRITDVNISNEERGRLVDQLKAKYPQFLKFLKDEKTDNESLSTALSEINELYIKRIALQTQQDKIEKLLKKSGEQAYRLATQKVKVDRELSKINSTILNNSLDLTNKSYEERIKLVTNVLKENAKFSNSERTGVTSALNDEARAYEKLTGLLSKTDTTKEWSKRTTKKLIEEEVLMNEIETQLGTTLEEINKLFTVNTTTKKENTNETDENIKKNKELAELKFPSLGVVEAPDVAKKQYREALKSVIEEVYGSLDASAEKGLLELDDFVNTDGVTIGLEVLADQLGVTYDELYGEFTSLYQKDYDNFLKYSQLKAEQANKEAELRLEAEEKAIQLLLDIGNAYFETRLNKIDEQIQKNNEYYDNIINNEESSEEQKKIAETQKEKRNKQLEDKKKKEQRKALIFQRIVDIGNVLRSDAMARAAALESPPVGLGPLFGASLFPLITLNTALSLGSIAAQTIPALEKGKKASEPYEGPAIWGEKRHEVKYSKDGSIEVSPSKPTFTYVQRDDVVYPSVGDFLSAHPEFSAQQLERVAFDTNHARGTFTLPYTHLGKQLATLKTEVKQGVKEGLSHFKNHITIQNRVNLPHLNWKNNKGYV